MVLGDATAGDTGQADDIVDAQYPLHFLRALRLADAGVAAGMAHTAFRDGD